MLEQKAIKVIELPPKGEFIPSEDLQPLDRVENPVARDLRMVHDVTHERQLEAYGVIRRTRQTKEDRKKRDTRWNLAKKTGVVGVTALTLAALVYIIERAHEQEDAAHQGARVTHVSPSR